MRRTIWILGLVAVVCAGVGLVAGDAWAQDEPGCGCGCAPDPDDVEEINPGEEEGEPVPAPQEQEPPPPGPPEEPPPPLEVQWEDEDPIAKGWYQDKYAGELLDMIVALDPPGEPGDANSLHHKIQQAVNLRKNNRFMWHGARTKPPSEDGPDKEMTRKESWSKILVAYLLAKEAGADIGKWQRVLDELDPGMAGVNDANWAAATKVMGPHPARWYLDKIQANANLTPAQGGAGPNQRAQINAVIANLLSPDPAWPKNVSHGVAWAKTVLAYYAQFPTEKNWYLTADELNSLD